MPKKSLDVLILFILMVARVQIDFVVDNTLPAERHDLVRQWVQGWWPSESLTRLAHPQTDPFTMMLYVIAFGLLVFYLLADLWGSDSQTEVSKKWAYRLKMGLLYGIIALLVFGKTVLLINLRHLSVPWGYSHDGGVIQTEATVDFFLRGLNPYVEDYLDTPMAQWGIDEYRTALYHYPYLPWTFVFSTPAYLLSQAAFGWYDQRFVYLILFAAMLGLIQSLLKKRRHKLLALMIIGLNPGMSLDLIIGFNDPYVLFWLVLAVWLISSEFRVQSSEFKSEGKTLNLKPGTLNYLLGSAALGLACASKPTAWFLVPFWGLFLLADGWGDKLIPPLSRWKALSLLFLRRSWPLFVAALLLLLPWFIWNPGAMYDDVWRWSAGQGETGYQIWGWGASNLVLALGFVTDRFAYWPFIVPQAIVGVGLLWLLFKRQIRQNTLGTMLYGYTLFLFIFFYLSRFMQPNYLGFLGSLLALAYFISREEAQPARA